MTDLLPADAVLRRLARLRVEWREAPAIGAGGQRPGRRHGASRELVGVRAYEAGDDLRDLDWAASARSTRPHVRQYRHEVEAALLLLLDTSASMAYGDPTKLAYGQALAAALGYLAFSHEDAVGALTFSDAVGGTLPVSRGRARWPSLRALLREATPAGRADLAEAVRRLPFGGGHRGIAIVLSDFYPPERFARGLERLASAGLATIALHLLSPGELSPTLAGEVELVDLETGETRSGFVGETERAQYRAALDGMRARVGVVCRNAGARHVSVSTGTPIAACLETTLVHAGVLRRTRA